LLVDEFGAFEVGELADTPFDLIGCDALALGRGLRGLGLQRALGAGQALALLEEFLLETRRLLCIEGVDHRLDLSLLIRLRLGERRIHRLRNLDLRALTAHPVQATNSLMEMSAPHVRM
jgi:hypothetical protein